MDPGVPLCTAPSSPAPALLTPRASASPNSDLCLLAQWDHRAPLDSSFLCQMGTLHQGKQGLTSPASPTWGHSLALPAVHTRTQASHKCRPILWLFNMGGGGISPGPVTLPQPKAEVLPTSFNQLLSPSSAMIAGNQEPCLSHEMITPQHLLTADRCRGTDSRGVPQGNNITAEHSSAEEVFCRERRVDKTQSPGRSSLVWLHLRRAFKAPRATDSNLQISETSHPRGPGSDCEVPLTCVTPGNSHRLN